MAGQGEVRRDARKVFRAAVANEGGTVTKQVRQLDRVVIRFAGDSGDGMQLTGDRFTSETAQLGNDISTLPNFPAEIRAPAGTLPGVSSFQVHFADFDILTPGDAPNVLVAMNPAALKANLADLPRRRGHHRQHRRVHQAQPGQGRLRRPTRSRTARWTATSCTRSALTSMTVGALADLDDLQEGRRAGEEHVRARPAVLDVLAAVRVDAARSWSASSPPGRSWSRPTSPRSRPAGTSARPPRTSRSATRSSRPRCRRATTATSPATRRSRWAWSPPGCAPSCRSSSARTRSRRPRDILHELSKHKRFGVTTMQAEDEIAAVGAALGASYGGALGVTTTSGPGVALKGETISLAVALELPLVDHRRAAGRPVDRHADQDRAGRPQHGAVRPARRGAGRGDRAAVAVRLLLRRARGGPDRADLPHAGDPALRRLRRQRLRAVAAARRGRRCPTCGSSSPPSPTARTARRSCPTCATRRRWPGRGRSPARPGLEHRIGGLEKADKTGDISYDPANHDFMVRTRAARIEAIEVPDVEVEDPDGDARVLVLGWGSTYGPIGAACRALRQRGLSDRPGAPAAPRPDAGATSARCSRAYDKVVIPEMNLGQLAHVIRARYLVDAIAYNQVRGLPFTAAELETMLEEVVKNA